MNTIEIPQAITNSAGQKSTWCQKLKLLYLGKVLPRMLKAELPSRIPRSGPSAEKVNVFEVTVNTDEGQPYLLVNQIKDSTLDCRTWDTDRYTELRQVALSSISPKNLSVTHYLGLWELKFTGINGLFWGRTLRLRYMIYLWQKLRMRMSGMRPLPSKERVEILEQLIDQHCTGRSQFTVDQLLASIHSVRWVDHPEGGQEHCRMRLYKDAMLEAGEIKAVNGSGERFEITGKALQTMESYRADERRHRDSVAHQSRLIWLTWLIAFAALAQAGFIRLPLVVDLSGLAQWVSPPSNQQAATRDAESIPVSNADLVSSELSSGGVLRTHAHVEKREVIIPYRLNYELQDSTASTRP